MEEAGGGEGFGEGVGGGEGHGEVGAAEGVEGGRKGGGGKEVEEGDVAVEGVGVVGLCGGPGEEARGGEVVGEGAEGVGDEGGGECDEVLAAEEVEVGLHGGGPVEEGEDLRDPRRGLRGGNDFGEVAEGFHHLARRREGCAERASCIVAAQRVNSFDQGKVGSSHHSTLLSDFPQRKKLCFYSPLKCLLIWFFTRKMDLNFLFFFNLIKK